MTHHNKGNQYAVKPIDNLASSYIHARCKTQDKAVWVKSAQSEKLKLTEWIIKTLNMAAIKQPR